ncbi:MAG: hypothetical protein AB1411_11950 [Nitrospirota bacterium]
MLNRAIAMLGATLILAAGGCVGPVGMQRDEIHPSHVVVSMLDQHLNQLNANISGLEKRIAELQRMPDTPDPTVREIRALDLAGWQLHQQQWALQRDHFRLAQDQLHRAQGEPGQKPQLLAQWLAHEKEYEAALEDFRRRRYELERKRLQVEARVVERYLR